MHTSLSKKLLAGLLSVVMVLSLFVAVPANNAQAASLSLSGNTKVSAGVTNTYKILNMAKTQYAKVTVSNKAVTVKKGTATVKSTTKIAGTGKAIALKANAKAAVAGKSYTLTVKVYNKKTNKVVKTLKKVVKVYNKTEAVALDQSTVTVDAGKTATLVATTTPAENTRPVTWTSSNEAVATVVDGVVTAVGAGTATITAKSGFCTAEATVTVYGKLDIKDVAPASSGKEITIIFTAPVKDVAAKNFYVDGDILVSGVSLSADGLVATLSLSKPLTSTVTYTVRAYDVTPVYGDVVKELSKEITWVYNEGAKLAIANNISTIGQTTSFVVTDASGADVTTVTNVEMSTSNSNIVAVTTGTASDIRGWKLTSVSAGTATVTAKVTLLDGTILSETFEFTVGSEKVENKGYTLYADANNDEGAYYKEAYIPNNAPANAAECKSYTILRWANAAGTAPSAKLAAFLNKNGDPEKDQIDFTGAKVESLNPGVAVASITGSDLTVTATANVNANASFRVTMPDKTVYSYTVTIQKAPEFTSVGAYYGAFTLSDEAASGLGTQSASVQGIDYDNETIYYYDQYGEVYTFPSTFGGHLVISSNSYTGVKLNNTSAPIDVPVASTSSKQYQISAVSGQAVNATITAKLYDENEKLMGSASTTVKVVNVKGDATAADVKYFDVRTASEIDANGVVSLKPTSIDYANATIYLLDANKNRLAKVKTGVGAIQALNNDTGLATKKAKQWVGVTGDVLAFDSNALYYASISGTVGVKIRVSKDGYSTLTSANEMTQILNVKYTNSKSIPHSAALTTSNLTIKGDGTSMILSIADILFGVIDNEQMLLDDANVLIGTANDRYMAIKSVATNGGYKYNKPVVEVKDMNGKVMSLGTKIYGLSDDVTNGNVWATVAADGKAQAYGTFKVSALAANVEGAAIAGAVTEATSFTVAAGETVSFVLVVNKISVAGDDNTHEDENLLSAPQTITVTVQN